MSVQNQPGLTRLEPPPYQKRLCAYFKSANPEVWDWFRHQRSTAKYEEAVRLELLKSTYRIPEETEPTLYRLAASAAESLELDVPITLYQGQSPVDLNCTAAPVVNAAHIVLYGSIGSFLSEAEVLAMFGHELSHLLLWHRWEGEMMTADNILAALSHDERADDAHRESARLFSLFTELFCDRGAAVVSGNELDVISLILKLETQEANVSAESFIEQAKEFIVGSGRLSEHRTHPDSVIRAHALHLWFQGETDVEETVERILIGERTLDSLDLLGRQRVERVTRRLIRYILSPQWMRSELALAHARLFAENAIRSGSAEDKSSLVEAEKDNWLLPIDLEELDLDLNAADDSYRDYVCFLLLDFATVDRDLEEYPLAWAMEIAEALDLKKRFREIATKELRMRKSQFDKLDKSRSKLLQKIGARSAAK